MDKTFIRQWDSSLNYPTTVDIEIRPVDVIFANVLKDVVKEVRGLEIFSVSRTVVVRGPLKGMLKFMAIIGERVEVIDG